MKRNFFKLATVLLLVALVAVVATTLLSGPGTESAAAATTVTSSTPAASVEQSTSSPAASVATIAGPSVVNVRVTAHRETPGLGDRIELPVSDWILGFNGRRADGTDWRPVPAGDIDAMTGATITARAVSAAVGEALGND